jgi:hypothetical protein
MTGLTSYAEVRNSFLRGTELVAFNDLIRSCCTDVSAHQPKSRLQLQLNYFRTKHDVEI